VAFGYTGNPGEGLEHPIAGKQLGTLQPLEAEEHGIQQRQQHLPDAVARVALREAHAGGESSPQVEAGEKAMEEIDAPEVREVARTEADADIVGPSGHDAQTYRTGRFARNAPTFGFYVSDAVFPWSAGPSSSQ